MREQLARLVSQSAFGRRDAFTDVQYTAHAAHASRFQCNRPDKAHLYPRRRVPLTGG